MRDAPMGVSGLVLADFRDGGRTEFFGAGNCSGEDSAAGIRGVGESQAMAVGRDSGDGGGQRLQRRREFYD